MSLTLALLFFWCGSVFSTAVYAWTNRLVYEPRYVAADMAIIGILAFIGAR